jgi:NTE family protein
MLGFELGFWGCLTFLTLLRAVPAGVAAARAERAALRPRLRRCDWLLTPDRRAVAGRVPWLLAAAAGVVLGGCAVRPITPELAQYEPDAGYRWDTRRALPDNDPETLLVLTFSGGGTRAAAFSYGVLEELRRTKVPSPRGERPVLAEVDLITGTSGGSFTALAYALYGERLFDDYDRTFLKRDVEGDLLRRLFDPLTWPRVLSQGFGRSELAEEYYDEILFHGATYADLAGKPTPAAIVGGTDVSTGTRFDFSQLEFDIICGDLGKFRLSRAAAASSAVPIVLTPVTLDNRGGRCGYRPPGWVAEALDRPDPLPAGNRLVLRLQEMERLRDGAARPYIHLVDGGLSDNLALYGPVEMLQELLTSPRYRAAAGVDRVRRIAVVIVNARSAPRFDWDKVPYGPGVIGLLEQSISVPINHYSTEAIAALQELVTNWQLQARLDADAKVAVPVPAIEFSIVDVSFERVADPALREYLQNLPTTLALSGEAVDRVRAAAAQVLRESPAFRHFVASLAIRP